MPNPVKAILFDSGRVLNGPATGHWFIPPHFFEWVDRSAFAAIPHQQRREAFARAARSIGEPNLIPTVTEEYQHFLGYYRILFQHLPQLKMTDDRIAAVANDLVYNNQKYRFYDDVFQTIPTLNRQYKLAVVSDAWPSLEDVFRAAGLRDYFSAFVISSALGVTKPDPRMYTAALRQLQIAPEAAVFVDDNPQNCHGAKALGIRSILLCREPKLFWYRKLCDREFPVVRDLHGLLKSPTLLR